MTPTAAKQWKHTQLVRLPSGNIVEMRPPGFDLVLRSGRVPDFLIPIIIKGFKGEAVDDAFPINELKDSIEFMDALDLFCELAFVSPRVVREPKTDDEISPDMIDFDDKAFVFIALGKSVTWLENFRPGQETSVEPVVGESGLSDEAKPAPEAETAPAA